MNTRNNGFLSWRYVLPSLIVLVALGLGTTMAFANPGTKNSSNTKSVSASTAAMGLFASSLKDVASSANTSANQGISDPLAACSTTINGAVTVQDSLQTGRLASLLTSSSCANPRTYPGTFDTLARHYDAYTFVNTGGATCVTVDLSPLLGTALVQSSAYLGTFNPADISQNYLADIGPIPSILGGSYSFTVPAGATYVVVVSELLPGIGGAYTLHVTADPTCQLTATPTSTPNLGATQTAQVATVTAIASQTSGAATLTAQATATATSTPNSATQTALASQTVTATPTACAISFDGSVGGQDGQQAGRIVTLLAESTCASPRTFPGTFDGLPRQYDAYTFVNNGPATCVTVDLSPLLATALVQSSAYLGSFNPNNLGQNYLADIGPVPSILGGSYSFTVPAGATYVVVVNELLPGIGGAYHLNVHAQSFCPVTATPGTTTATTTATPNGATQTAQSTQTSVSQTQTAVASQTAGNNTPTSTPTACTVTFNDTVSPQDSLQIGRLSTLLTESTCANPRSYPGTFDTLPRHFHSYTFVNNGPAACVTVDLSPLLATALVQSSAYLGSFNPSDISQNYLADIGPVPSILGGSYSFTVPAGATYVVVVSELVPGIGGGYTLHVTAPSVCPVTATPTENSATQTAIASQTAGAPTHTATATPNSATQTAIASQTAGAPTATATSNSATQTAVASETAGAPTETASSTPNSATQTAVASETAGAPTGTSTPNDATQTAIASQTAGAPTATVCPIQFTDVAQGSTFYQYIRCLVCRGIINGYPCGGVGEPCDASNNPYFRPSHNVTRGQLSKMASNSAGFSEVIPPTQQTFQDVTTADTFWPFVERLAMRGYIDGYPCGQRPNEPCVAPQNRSYFRPGTPISRGQIAKVISNSAGFDDAIPQTTQTFVDEPNTDTFWVWVERLSMRDVMQGYPCGTLPAGPCVEPDNKPYFLAYNSATRGQTSKFISNTFFPECNTP